MLTPAETAQRQQRIEALAGELKELTDKTRGRGRKWRDRCPGEGGVIARCPENRMTAPEPQLAAAALVL
jgi:hypothetical protein